MIRALVSKGISSSSVDHPWRVDNCLNVEILEDHISLKPKDQLFESPKWGDPFVSMQPQGHPNDSQIVLAHDIL